MDNPKAFALFPNDAAPMVERMGEIQEIVATPKHESPQLLFTLIRPKNADAITLKAYAHAPTVESEPKP
jgi:hypothetical protein